LKTNEDKKHLKLLSYFPVLAAIAMIVAFLIIAINTITLIAVVSIVVSIICILAIQAGARAKRRQMKISFPPSEIPIEVEGKKKKGKAKKIAREREYATTTLPKYLTEQVMSLEETIVKNLERLGASQVYLSQVLEGEKTKHEIDIVFKKEDKTYLMEIKKRLLVPSDIENLSGIYQDIVCKNRDVQKVFLFTTGDVAESVRRIAMDSGINIVKPEDLKKSRTILEAHS